MQADCLEVLIGCAARAGVGIDPVRVRLSLSQAEREHAGPWSETWLARLVGVGEDLGFRVMPQRGTLEAAASAASESRPAVVFVPGEGGDGRWLVIAGSRGRKVRVGEAAAGGLSWVNRSEFERRLGLTSRDALFEWAALEPLAQCGALSDHHHADHDAHHHGPSPLSRLIQLIRPEGRDVRAVVVFAVGVGVLTLATPLAVEALVTTVAMSLMMQQLVVLSLVLFACLSLAAAMRVMQSYLVEVIQRRVFVRVAADLAYRLPRVRIDAFDRDYGPELVNRFFDVLTVQKVVALLLLDGITIVLQTAVGLALLAFYHPYLLGFDLVMVVAMTLTVFLLGRGAVTTSIRESLAKYALAGQLEELARVPPAFKLEGGSELAVDRVDALARRYLGARKAHFAVVLRQTVFAMGFQAAASAALLGLGGWLVIEGQLTLGQLVAAELIVATIAGSFTKLGKHLEGWYDLMAAVDKLGHLVDLPLERHDGETFRADATVGAALRLSGVAYAYGEGAPEVLRGLNLDVTAGERVAVLGSSGSGKSTLADLVCGLRVPTRGHIEIDGVNLRDLSLESLRRQVAVVKGVEVIEGTVIENVRLGRSKITADEVRSALRAVGLWDELARLPEGLHTRLSSHATPLSQGQARRLMLARAIAARPRLLLLDETLDGLDLEARGQVIQSLFNHATPWPMTLLVVTHDEAVAQLCDQAFVLVNGHADHSKELASTPDLGAWLEEMRSCPSA